MNVMEENLLQNIKKYGTQKKQINQLNTKHDNKFLKTSRIRAKFLHEETAVNSFLQQPAGSFRAKQVN